MAPLAYGAAFVDRSGTVVAADPWFLSLLGLPAEDPSGALRNLADGDPRLERLLSGDGPALVPLEREGRATLEIERVLCEGGALLLLREPPGRESEEHAMRSRALGPVAAGVAHDIKNSLNTMSLQVALLAEKLARSQGIEEAGRHLGTLREQVVRVNEVVRRLVDVVDPAPLGFADLGALVSDVAGLLGHEARSRGIDVEVTAPRLAAVTRCDPGRVARLVVGLLTRALADTPGGGSFSIRVEANGGTASLAVERTASGTEDGLGYESEVAAAAAGDLGGTFSMHRVGGRERWTLVLPGNARP